MNNCSWVKEFDKKAHRFRYFIECKPSHCITERMYLTKERMYNYCPYCGKKIRFKEIIKRVTNG